MTEWRTVACDNCGGYGVVSHYSYDDFEGPEDCRRCNGTGTLYVSPRDRLAAWPGGPLRGTWPGGYAKALREVGHADA